MHKTFNIVQISDPHLFKDRNLLLNDVNPYENLRNVFEYISKFSNKPDLLMVTGDLSQDASLQSYNDLKDFLDGSNIDYYLIPGNHDDINTINKAFNYDWTTKTVDYSFELDAWYFYALNTSRYPNEAGELSEEQLINLTKALEYNKAKNTVLFLHHHPLLVNSLWIDRMSLKAPERFNQIVQSYENIKAVFFGHIHQVFEEYVGGTLYASSPSTVYQVVPNSDKFQVEKRNPGFRLIQFDETNIKSQIIWI